MKLIYLVNNISKTSIPWRWADYINKSSSLVKVSLLSIKNIFKIDSTSDIVHGHHIKSMFLYLILNIFLRKKSVYTVHGSYQFLSKINIVLLKFIFKKSDNIIFVNKELYDSLIIELKILIENKYSIILNGVEINYKYVKSDVYKKFNIDKNDIIIFHPARFVIEKNHLRIISALKLLVEKNNKIKLVLAGDGKLKEEIIEHIEKLELTDNIILLGLIDRDEVYNFLEKSDLFIMPSISEGLNIAFLEAISMNSRILVSDIEQFTYPIKAYELNAEKINISFVDPKSEKDIADGIIKLLEKEKNYQYDCKDFSLKTMMEKYEVIYKKLMEKKNVSQ